MLEGRDLAAGFAGRMVLQGVSLQLAPGQIFGLSGPSGRGKTTLGRIMAGLMQPARGQVTLAGRPLPRRGVAPVQYLSQHPVLTMNPRWRVARILAEGGPVDPQLAQDLAVEQAWADRLPAELSGGQLQRVALLRALNAQPRYLIADEITAALDPLAQAQIWHHLARICAARGIGVLAISHDAALLARISAGQMAL